MNNEENAGELKIPFIERVKKFALSVFGKEYLYVGHVYDPSRGMMGVIWDYNNPMLNRIREEGFIEDDPDDAVRRYIQTFWSFHKQDLIEDESDEDEDFDYENEGSYIHRRDS